MAVRADAADVRLAATSNPHTGAEKMSSERKWTKGPWRADCNAQDGGYHVEATIDGSRVLVICSRAPWTGRREMSLANAALIASAPDLLEALEMLKAAADRLYSVANVVRREYEVASISASSAIARAQGKG